MSVFYLQFQTHRRVHFESLYLIRQGLIKIEKSTNEHFEISYSISLNYLTFFSVLVGFATGFLGVFFSNIPVIIGIASSIIVYVYGFVGIQRNTERIIRSVIQK